MATVAANGPMKNEQDFPFAPLGELSVTPPARVMTSSTATSSPSTNSSSAVIPPATQSSHLSPPHPAIVTSHPHNNTHCYNNNNHNGQREHQRNRSSESSTSPSASSLHADDDVIRGNSLVDESFMRHYNVKEIQTVANSSSLVDEEFLRHYRVDEIAASMGFSSPYSGNYGYDYFMGGKSTKELFFLPVVFFWSVFVLRLIIAVNSIRAIISLYSS